MERPQKAGTMIKHYEIKQCIGMGSYGIAYQAFDHEKNRLVCLKETRRFRRDVQKVHRSFTRECEMLQMIDVDSFPKVYDFFLDKERSYLVLQLMNGKTFEHMIFNEKVLIEEQQAFYYLLQVSKVVQIFHNQGIVHRDLRIPNILWDGSNVRIIDFGLARYNYEKDHRINTYSEDKKLMRQISYRSDLFALGHFVLFLLYSSYVPTSKKQKSWEEELDISGDSRYIIRKLLLLDEPFEHISELISTLVNLDRGSRNVFF
ncbi:protein kinase [Bacillus carboniphilus]|uniref:Protein kinase n=1 Tax=Bacillus carboniphilus TaxID=86663 RepID=A0ABY9JV97_9BACI|nr:protein kinase [Bacillus carboniphilus]WLR43331.1 protein kinase [Bacillus carboniphilus]